MGLLTALGVNETLIYQFAIFSVVFFCLNYILFKPYFKAFLERTEATVGQTELAERYVAETQQLEAQFAARAREVSEKFREVYEKNRSEALKEYDRMVNESRLNAKELVENARAKIQKDMELARQQLAKEVPGVAKLIIHKMIGKDLSA